MLESTRDRIIDSITSFREKCYDVSVDSKDLNPVINGSLKLNYKQKEKVSSVVPNTSAESQLLTKLTVPVSFFHRCPAVLQQLILDNFNHDKNFLLRCVGDEAGDYCRAVLSSMFTLNYDNHLVFPIVLDVLAEHEVSLRSFMNDGIITRMEILCTDATVNHKERKIVPGLMVTNSETGHSSLWIEPIVVVDGSFIFASRRAAYAEYKKFRQIHKGEGLTPEDITETVSKALEAAQVGIIQYIEAMDAPIKPQAALDFCKAIDALPKRFVALWEDEWKEKEELKKEQVVREILMAVADLPLLSRIPVEQAAGQWYGMFNGYTSRFEKLREQMETIDLEA